MRLDAVAGAEPETRLDTVAWAGPGKSFGTLLRDRTDAGPAAASALEGLWEPFLVDARAWPEEPVDVLPPLLPALLLPPAGRDWKKC